MPKQSKAAIKPDVFATFRDIDEGKTVDQKRKEMDPEDIALSALSNHNGWSVLSKYIDHLKNEMDGLVASLIAGGGTFEDVGKITVVANLAKEKLNAIQQRVEDAKETAETVQKTK